MRISFPYPDIDPLEIPDKNLIGLFSPSTMKVDKSEEEIIKEALIHPIGSLPLSQRLKGREKVLVLVDDYTRTTPTQKILPLLMEELKRTGIHKERIQVLVALGTHRPMTEEEMRKKFGEEFLKEFPVMNHCWWDSSQLVFLGETEKGTPILVNRIIHEVDFIIGVGQIVPHRVSGFSGGGNIIQPGICGEETTGKTHWLSAKFRGQDILGKIENPVKDEIEQVALKAGLRWIINTIQDGTGRTVDAVAGDPLLAYRKGAERSLQVYRAEIPMEADIVIADSHPYDSDLWLAAKGIYASELAVKEGGLVILITPCPEGVSPSHPEVLELGYQTYKDTEEMIQKGSIQKWTVAAHLVHVGRVIKERAKGMMVSKGISKRDTERLGFIYAKDPKEALEVGFRLLGREAKITVLQRGGEILPQISSNPQE